MTVHHFHCLVDSGAQKQKTTRNRLKSLECVWSVVFSSFCSVNEHRKEIFLCDIDPQPQHSHNFLIVLSAINLLFLEYSRRAPQMEKYVQFNSHFPLCVSSKASVELFLCLTIFDSCDLICSKCIPAVLLKAS